MNKRTNLRILSRENSDFFEQDKFIIGSKNNNSSKKFKSINPQKFGGHYSREIKPQTDSQVELIEKINNSDITFALGSAGTGKTFIAIAKAVEALQNSKYKKIILTRPAVEAGEKLGFLPGDMREKVDPYMLPLYDALSERISYQQIQVWLSDKTIEICPIGFLRGRTLRDAFIIIDEAQNATVVQLKMILTRLGHGSKMVFTGDPGQNDLPIGQSGLVKISDSLNNKLSKISVVKMSSKDIVRHDTVRDMLPFIENLS
jgi:phosphate starvation-inducible PhoH-like protein